MNHMQKLDQLEVLAHSLKRAIAMDEAADVAISEDTEECDALFWKFIEDTSPDALGPDWERVIHKGSQLEIVEHAMRRLRSYHQNQAARELMK